MHGLGGWESRLDLSSYGDGLPAELAGDDRARAVVVGERRGDHPRAVREAAGGAPLLRPLLQRRRRGQHPRGGPRAAQGRSGRRLLRRRHREGDRGGVPRGGVLPGGEPRGKPRVAPTGTRGVARLLPPSHGGEAALRQLAQHLRGLRQPPRGRQGRHFGLGRLLFPPLPPYLLDKPPKVACSASHSKRDDGRVRRGIDEAVPENTEGIVDGTRTGGGAPAGGVRRGRCVHASELLPEVPAAGAHAWPLGPLRPRRNHHPPRRRPRRRAPGPQGQLLDHRPAAPRRLHRQRGRPDSGAEQRDVQERGAPRDGERRVRTPVHGLLLQPSERHPHRTHPGPGLPRSACSVPAHDLRPVPPLHPAERPARQKTSQLIAHRRRTTDQTNCLPGFGYSTTTIDVGIRQVSAGVKRMVCMNISYIYIYII